MSQPTQPSVHDTDWRLTSERSRITFLAPPGNDVDRGVTFELAREGATKLLRVDRVLLSCAPASSPASMADTAADRFDQP